MQGFNINDVPAPGTTVQGQVIPPTGGGGWGTNCQPGVDGTTPDADFFNDLLGNLLRVLQAAGVAPTPNRYDDLLQAIEELIGASAQQLQTTISKLGPYVRQGGGANQGANQIYVGWRTTGGLAVTVDQTDLGNVVFEAELALDVANLNNSIGGVANALNADVNNLQGQINGLQNSINNKPQVAPNGIAAMSWSTTPAYGSSAGPTVVDDFLTIVFANGESRMIATTTQQSGNWFTPRNYTSFTF
ncbi:hypothetical protein FAZ95_13755 [Trinickia violacea]|uniref:Tail fiber protein n=1 Tax=Trinickia violacea TaxID=2571746 RepID=A0A4P8IMF9_9BURK|nr:hypothetical protein [Trinickia violacea]QCP50148.1 hypothetical protein FAZ95_13755 [Trinickia violacea]